MGPYKNTIFKTQKNIEVQQNNQLQLLRKPQKAHYFLKETQRLTRNYKTFKAWCGRTLNALNEWGPLQRDSPVIY